MKTFILFLLIAYCYSTVIPEKYFKYLSNISYLAEQYRENCFKNDVLNDDDTSEEEVSWSPGEIEYLENLALSLLAGGDSHELHNIRDDLDSVEDKKELTSDEDDESGEVIKGIKKDDKTKGKGGKDSDEDDSRERGKKKQGKDKERDDETSDEDDESELKVKGNKKDDKKTGKGDKDSDEDDSGERGNKKGEKKQGKETGKDKNEKNKQKHRDSDETEEKYDSNESS